MPAAAAGVGAIATQADANLSYKYLGLAHLDYGATAQVALDRLVEDDDGREHRQAGIVDSERRGLWAYYYVLPGALDDFAAWLD